MPNLLARMVSISLLYCCFLCFIEQNINLNILMFQLLIIRFGLVVSLVLWSIKSFRVEFKRLQKYFVINSDYLLKCAKINPYIA